MSERPEPPVGSGRSMASKPSSRPYFRLPPRLIDVAIMLFLAALAFLDADLQDALLANAAIFLGLVATLVLPQWWRTRYPFWVFLIVLSFGILANLTAGQGFAVSLVSLLVAIFGVGAYAPRHSAKWALGLSVLFVAPRYFQDESTLIAAIAQLIVIFTAWVLGIYLGTRRSYLELLEHQTRSLQVEQDQQARLAVAAERTRIAREMHDIVSHNLTVMITLSEAASVATPTSPEQASATMSQVSEAGREALGEMRRVLGVLRAVEGTSQRSPQPDIAALPELVAQIGEAGLATRFSVDGDGLSELPEVIQVAAYRIVQEALTNALRHSGPESRTDVQVSRAGDDQTLSIRVHNTRPGVTNSTEANSAERGWTEGNGITGMRERAHTFGGNLNAGPVADGWQVDAEIPVTARQDT